MRHIEGVWKRILDILPHDSQRGGDSSLFFLPSLCLIWELSLDHCAENAGPPFLCSTIPFLLTQDLEWAKSEHVSCWVNSRHTSLSRQGTHEMILKGSHSPANEIVAFTKTIRSSSSTTRAWDIRKHVASIGMTTKSWCRSSLTSSPPSYQWIRR